MRGLRPTDHLKLERGKVVSRKRDVERRREVYGSSISVIPLTAISESDNR
jgi:hypothetical protein